MELRYRNPAMSVRRWRQESTPRSARNSRALRELRERTPHIPMIIDTGIGLPSHACQGMEFRRRVGAHHAFYRVSTATALDAGIGDLPGCSAGPHSVEACLCVKMASPTHTHSGGGYE